LFEVYIVSFVTVIDIALSAFRSKLFFKILDSFYRFDKFTLQMRCPSNNKSQQFYLVFILLVCTYHISILVVFINERFFILFMWNLFCLLTMIATIQYIICIKMLNDRYKLANILFENSKYLSIKMFKCNIIYWFSKMMIIQNIHRHLIPRRWTYNCIIPTWPKIMTIREFVICTKLKICYLHHCV